jgi:hypothetical protein
MTRSIPYWTTSVFSSTVTNDERRISAHALNSLNDVCLTNHSFEESLSSESESETESYVTTDGQSASLSLNKAPIWGLR